MSIESLVQKIIEDARKVSSQIEQKALGEVKTCEDMAEREVQVILDTARERAVRSLAGRKQRMISIAELEDRKETLYMKQRLIEEAFSGAMKKILSFDGDAYGAFLSRLILQANPEGDEDIILNQRDRDRFGGNVWIKGLNQNLLENKKKGKMRVADETRSIQGGAILRRGRKEINCSLESVIKSKRNELETIVAGILFEDSE